MDNGIAVFDEFDASGCGITSDMLTMLPRRMKVLGKFDISDNEIDSLTYLPPELSVGSFHCGWNRIQTLEGLGCYLDSSFFVPTFTVEKDFNCQANKLKNLKGLPTPFNISGTFNCSMNQITSLYDLPPNFSCKDFDCSENQLTTLMNYRNFNTIHVNGSFYCFDNSQLRVGAIMHGLPASLYDACTIRKAN